MAEKFQVVRSHKNGGLFGIVVLIYVALLLLFAWQTLMFVNILFPDSDLLMKILTVFSVDGMGFVWACLHTFYKFAHPHAKGAVRWGWGVTYGLSSLLSILYLVFTYILDFQHVTDTTYIKIGVGASIAALMFNLAMISIFLFYEISTRYPNEDEFIIVEKSAKVLDHPQAKAKEEKVLDPHQHRQLPDGTNTGDYAVVASNGNGNGNGHTSKNGKGRQGN